MNTPTETETSERRSGAERRLDMRREDLERRKGRRRSGAAEIDLDLRVSRDRRVELRRGMYDRRGRIVRRMVDRRRGTPSAFSQDDTQRIKLMMERDPGSVVCPVCFDPLPVERPAAVSGTEIWEVRCGECSRMAIITKAAGRRVLIVDANEIVRDALSMVFQRAGHFVSEAGTGITAIEVFESERPDVVVVDLDSPGQKMAGMVREMLRKAPRTIFLVLAGRGRIGAPDPAISVKSLGRVEVVRKPFSPPAILEAMDRVLK
jgi:CheY-like chemotaxis protein